MKIKNQRGQVSVEYVLITIVLFSIFMSVRNVILSSNMLSNYVQGPWSLVAGMIENGVWGDPKTTRAEHPGALTRHNSLLGDQGS